MPWRNHLLAGGKRQASLLLTFTGKDMDTGLSTKMCLPLLAYDAGVVCDLILSYSWMATQRVLPDPVRHGLHLTDKEQSIWVPGIVTGQGLNVVAIHSLPMEVETLPPPNTNPPQEDIQYVQLIREWVQHEASTSHADFIRGLDLSPYVFHPRMAIEDCPDLAEFASRDLLDQADVEEIVNTAQLPQKNICYIRGFVDSDRPLDGPEVELMKENIRRDFAGDVFSEKFKGMPPKRGIFGEAEILIEPGTVPVKQRAFQMVGDRRTAWVTLTDQLISESKIEPGRGPWCSPSFPVPKKKPGEYRLVVDFRRLNESTEVDSHPLPRISDTLQRQGRFKIWTVWT